jgi:methylmalonyl-CoA/ethylmalonyl-CoA epimerase
MEQSFRELSEGPETTVPIAPGDLFEIALIVPDLEAAMDEFHQAFGYTWSPILEGVLPTRDDAGEETFPPFRMTVSRESPQLELMEAQPGTSIIPPTGTGLHHLGFYVDDLGDASERLASLGLPFECAGIADGNVPDGWVYHRMADGTIVELVDRNRAPLRKRLMEGHLPDSPWARRLVPVSDDLGGS